jgi:hypothetical protein
VGDNRTPAAATGLNVAAIDFTFAAGGWDGEESPRGPSRFTSEARDWTAAGQDVAAIDSTFAAVGWGGEESLLEPSGSTSEAQDSTADGLTDDCSLDTVSTDSGAGD